MSSSTAGSTRNSTRLWVGIAAVVLLAVVAALLIGGGSYRIEEFQAVSRLPKLSPDYTGIRIPFNIAPMNFVIQEPGSRYQVRLAAGEEEIVVSGTSPEVRIPIGRWKSLLADHRGESLKVEVFAEDPDAGWQKYETIVNEISEDPVDGYLVYRDIYPQFYVKGDMRIKQRSLEDFDERTIIDRRQLPGGCFNCHTFLNYKSDRFALQIRYRKQNYLVLYDKGDVSLVQPVGHKPGSAYLSWHPSGKALAITVNMGYRIFNLLAGAVPEEMLEYGDTEGDVAIYNIAENTVSMSPETARGDRVETEPSWSPDGKHLYFLSAPQLDWQHYEDIKYDLRRIEYDIDSDTWGECETVVSVAETGMGCSFPRVSPDGKFLLFGMSDRSSFTILREKTDLYMGPANGKTFRRLEINSERTDSYHTWASNSRWFAFVSKRRDGVHGLVYFTHVDEDGSVSKPFVLPQEDPRYYESFVRTYNAPEFLGEPVPIDQFRLGVEAAAIEKIQQSE